MKAGYKNLIALVQTATELPYAECFTLTLQTGDVFRYTNLDVPVWLNGLYYAANAVRVEGLKFKQSVGAQVDEQSITLIYGPKDSIYGIPWGQAIRQHVLDGAVLQRDRAFFDPVSGWPPAPLTGAVAMGSVTLFKGRVTTINSFGRTTATVNVKSGLVLLDIDFPRNVWQAACLHTLYDAGCGLSKIQYQSLRTVAAGGTYTTIPVTATCGAGAAFTVGLGSSGNVQAVTITDGGADYSNAAYLVFSGGGGEGATATATITNGVITAVTVTNAGQNYSSAPTLTAVDDPFLNFSQGTLMFQSGKNAGRLVQVKNATNLLLTLAQPLDYLPMPGDVMSIWPGCDHTNGPGGCAKFNNLANFRGYPYVPPPETAY